MCHPPKNGNSSEFRGNQRILVQAEGVAVLNFLGILKLKLLLSETMGIAREEWFPIDNGIMLVKSSITFIYDEEPSLVK